MCPGSCVVLVCCSVFLSMLSAAASEADHVVSDDHWPILSRFHGHPLMKGMHPYVVYVDPVHCTGTIIAVDWVLSAAHCFQGKEFQGSVRVYAGVVNQGDVTTAQFRTAKQFIHPKYEHFNASSESRDLVPSPARFYDLALLKTNRPFFLNEHIGVVKLAKGAVWSEDARCRTIGFGLTDGAGDNALKWLRVVAGTDRCRQFTVYEYMNHYFDGGNVVCGVINEESGKTACYGDSGAPLMCDGLQVGVLIAAADHDTKDYCDYYPRCGATSLVFAYVGFYSDWILSMAPEVIQEVSVRALQQEQKAFRELSGIRSASSTQYPAFLLSLVAVTCCLRLS